MSLYFAISFLLAMLHGSMFVLEFPFASTVISMNGLCHPEKAFSPPHALSPGASGPDFRLHGFSCVPRFAPNLPSLRPVF
jgi:hypothetical protein